MAKRTGVVAAAKKAVKRVKQKILSIGEGEIVFPWFDTGHRQLRRVDIVLKPKQRRGLRLLFDGLQSEGAELASGKAIKSQQDAIRWILEKVDDGAKE